MKNIVLENEKVIQSGCCATAYVSVRYSGLFFLYEKRVDHRRETRHFS